MQSAMLHNSLILLDPVPLQWASTAMPQLPIHYKHCRQAVLTQCQVSSAAVEHDMTLCAKYRMELHLDNQRVTNLGKASPVCRAITRPFEVVADTQRACVENDTSTALMDAEQAHVHLANFTRQYLTSASWQGVLSQPGQQLL